MKRRDFVKLSSLGTTAIILDGCKTKDSSEKKQIVYPVAGENIKVISTSEIKISVLIDWKTMDWH